MASINGTVAETPTTTTAEDVAPSKVPPENKWPGWPGECVFRLIVPVLKVGSIIGRKGDIIKKMCEETKARIRVLDPPVASTPDRIVLITGKEEPELPFSPAMDAVIRVFKRINGFPETEGESLASVPFCSIRLLVPSVQALSLIGKQGSSIKAIQESTGCSVRVLSDEVSLSALSANSDERVVDMQGEAIKVLKALESVLGHLRKFLVDRSVLPLFEKPNTVTSATQEHQVETSWIDKPVMRGTSGLQSHLGLGGGGGDYSLPMRRETLFADREPLHGLSLYGRDPGAGLTTAISPVLARTGGPIVTQVAQTMQIPLIYAEDIIGVAGTNIAYIRRTSGAILTVQESRGLPDEITVEIKGTAAQVQTAQQLIQECVNGQKESSIASGYGKLDSGLRSSYSQLGNSSYPPPPSSSAAAAAYGGPSPYGGGYGASGLGGYSSGYRM
ncbi:RNA-binding KH domain-containing protein PEPPER-like [Bidens hawaiensis]|uniref:RNA-binding KH domain-containing protein PEPPER-like n=1 Tax=Bidens hawaiensis TaxID=980011 RepID=UPI0040493E96